MAAAKEATIVMTVKYAIGLILGGAISLAATLALTSWVIWTWTMSGVRDDVASIKGSLEQMQASDRDIVQDAGDTETDLRGQLAELTTQLKVTTTQLADLNSTVGNLDDSIKAVDAKLTASVAAQRNFEQWVVTRLGADMKSTVPASWEKADFEIIDAIKAGDVSPLAFWYKAAAEQPK